VLCFVLLAVVYGANRKVWMVGPLK